MQYRQETKISLQEMDVVFKDSSATTDAERMRRVNVRVGLTPAGNLRQSTTPIHDAVSEDEKKGVLAEHVSP